MDKGIGDRRMYQNKIKLTAQEILEKDFKIDTRGYRLKEVDQFLDDVIADYEQYDQFIDDLVKEKEELLSEIIHLKQEIRNLKMNIDIAKIPDKEVTNADILRRLSQLEKIVYDKDEE